MLRDAIHHLGRSARPSTVLVLTTVAFLTAASSLLGLDAAANELARTADRVVSIAWSAPPMLIGLAVPLIVPAGLLWRRGSKDRQARGCRFGASGSRREPCIEGADRANVAGSNLARRAARA